MNTDPCDVRSGGNEAAQFAEPADQAGSVASAGSVSPAGSVESVESVAAVVDDIEAYLQRWMTRINRVLGHAYDLAYREDHVGQRENEFAQREIEFSRCEQELAEREHELQFRERQLVETTDEFRRLRERWAMQRDAEMEQMQQQVEELTEAWLRLEHEQRSSAFPSAGQRGLAKRDAADDADAAGGSPLADAVCDPADRDSSRSWHSDHVSDHDDADEATGVPGPASVPGPANVSGHTNVSGPASGSLLVGGSGPQPAVSGPATRASRAVSDVSPSGGERAGANAGRPTLPSPAPIPASLKGRHASTASGEPTHPDHGRPATISPADSGDPPPPRESSYQQFQHLQRELGHSSRPNR